MNGASPYGDSTTGPAADSTVDRITSSDLVHDTAPQALLLNCALLVHGTSQEHLL